MPLKTEILKTLVSGCALNSTIYADVQAYASSKQRFDGTLNELRVAEPALVQSAHYAAPGTDSHLALYALTQDVPIIWLLTGITDRTRSGLFSRPVIWLRMSLR